jgi:hypothetical protein
MNQYAIKSCISCREVVPRIVNGSIVTTNICVWCHEWCCDNYICSKGKTCSKCLKDRIAKKHARAKGLRGNHTL